MYKIIKLSYENPIEVFENKISEYIKEGFIPVGNFIVEGGYYMQAIYKNN